MSGLLTSPDRYKLHKFNSRRLKAQEVISFFSTASPLISNYYKMTFMKTTCDVLPEYRNGYLYFTIFYTIVVIILPLVIISLFNTLLILRLYRSNDQWTTTKLEMHEQELSYKEIRDKKVQIENLKITWTLIIISASFIVLTLPYGIMYFVDKLYGRTQKQIQTFLSYQLTKIGDLFYMLNHSINFFLYVLSRNSFRRVLKDKLKCECFNLKKSYTYAMHANNHIIERKFKWLSPHAHMSPNTPLSLSPTPDTEDNTTNKTKNSQKSAKGQKSQKSGGGGKKNNSNDNVSPGSSATGKGQTVNNLDNKNGEVNNNNKQLLKATTPTQPAVSIESYEEYWETYQKESTVINMSSLNSPTGVSSASGGNSTPIMTTNNSKINNNKCGQNGQTTSKTAPTTTVLKFDLLKKRMKSNK